MKKKSRCTAIPDAVSKLRKVAYACLVARRALADHHRENFFGFYGFPGSPALREEYRELAEKLMLLKARRGQLARYPRAPAFQLQALQRGEGHSGDSAPVRGRHRG